MVMIEEISLAQTVNVKAHHCNRRVLCSVGTPGRWDIETLLLPFPLFTDSISIGHYQWITDENNYLLAHIRRNEGRRYTHTHARLTVAHAAALMRLWLLQETCRRQAAISPPPLMTSLWCSLAMRRSTRVSSDSGCVNVHYLLRVE